MDLPKPQDTGCYPPEPDVLLSQARSRQLSFQERVQSPTTIGPKAELAGYPRSW